MSREMCYRCFWPKSACWCGSIRPMHTDTRIVILMHPKEYKEEKAGTGRLTHLCLENSEIIMGMGFDEEPRVRALLDDPGNRCVLLYPGPQAVNLSKERLPDEGAAGRRLVVFVLDGTWAGARKMLRLSRRLQALPRVLFTPTSPSRFRIKQQPQEGCLSTLEAVHELLCALEAGGADTYPDRTQLLDLFERMQAYQIRCAADPDRGGYRRKPYGDPATRRQARGEGTSRPVVWMPPPKPAGE